MVLSRSRSWALALLGVFIAYTAVTLVYLQPGPGTPSQPGPAPQPLLAVADGTQFLLMLVTACLCVWQAIKFQGRGRVFWLLMAVGASAWSLAMGAWFWFDVFLRKPIPEPFWADIVLFFHIVPFTAALIVRPHRPGEVRKIVLSAIDWAMLMFWWMFLYVFLVFPWQFIRLNVPKYNSNFNVLYIAENLLWLAILLGLFLTTRNGWRKIYGFLLAAGGFYIVASEIIDLEIKHGNYYSGSIFDLPLVAAMLIFVWLVANASELVQQPEHGLAPDAPETEALGPRLAMVAVLSIPVIVSWMDYSSPVHGDIYHFRLLTSMLAMVAMGALVFVKQYLLDLERFRLLDESRRNFENLQNLQAQLVRNEKLAALGQLVSGAAHEINNPLTAILGYAELMEYDARADETLKSHAGKIKQQVLRTKDLVNNLLRFARQPGGEKKRLDLNALIENSIQARQSDPANKAVRFIRALDPKLPHVLGDEKQLTDVCMQLLGNAAEILAHSGGGRITARTYQDDGWVVLEVSDSGPGMVDPARVFDPFFTTKTLGQGTGLGLSVCYGIVTDHKGFIFAENLPEGGARLVVRLPITTEAKPATATGNVTHQD